MTDALWEASNRLSPPRLQIDYHAVGGHNRSAKGQLSSEFFADPGVQQLPHS